jgi:hypothetical protein
MNNETNNILFNETVNRNVARALLKTSRQLEGVPRDFDIMVTIMTDTQGLLRDDESLKDYHAMREELSELFSQAFRDLTEMDERGMSQGEKRMLIGLKYVSMIAIREAEGKLHFKGESLALFLKGIVMVQAELGSHKKKAEHSL